MAKLSFEETLIEVWRQALVENAEAIYRGFLLSWAPLIANGPLPLAAPNYDR